MNHQTPFHCNILEIDAEKEVKRIAQYLRYQIFTVLKRSGGVIGVSGGIDSSVVLALAVEALGKEKIIPIIMPERESSPDSIRLARLICELVGVEPIVEDITEALNGYKSYQRRDSAVKDIFPEFDSSYTLKLTLPDDLLEKGTLNVFSLTIINSEGAVKSERVPLEQLRQIIAATNFKQRSRAAMLYYHAEKHSYAVIGTPPKNEHDLGFFVKYGDGAMDIKPIGHLYKSQVYQLGKHLYIPHEILTRPPSSDTYSAESTQQEFFFRLPYEVLDLLCYALENDAPIETVAKEMELSEIQVQRAYRDIQQKKRATRHLRLPPIGLDSASG